MSRKRIGFFTRALDDAPPAARYQLAAAQIRHAEALGYHSAWVAQHHFNGVEGGLPSPFPFLSYVAAQTSRIRLGTGVVTLTMEDPVRVAEDASVTDALSGGRLELGVGSGGTPANFVTFGRDFAERRRVYDAHLAALRKAWAGDALPGDNRLYPAADGLERRVWQATFSTGGGIKAGQEGDGLLLSRTQPRPKDTPFASLADLQLPIVEAYHVNLPSGVSPRILASRSVFVADNRAEARALAEAGLRKVAQHFQSVGHVFPGDTLDDLIFAMDSHVGTPEEVAESLAADRVLDHATEIAVQVHSIDPPHDFILRSIELFAAQVAPALGWIDPPYPARLRTAAV
ncbi:putative FMN-dependent luciferase-like monooxygenase [Cypionkella psychrotolerans]|uniref:putative FMN-dependent luciferase-like monooxygenase n=1 Tax=Cypionkella psychrotolerans TaxID=1678131 RepID=UPI0006B48313|nr:putative FMN-dependent luciferase-like monooxygenase [Cypionkella psychrotolerans]